MSLTPHGPGFSFLDAFEAGPASREGTGRKWLDPGLSFFADHFPGRPLMPGVLLIECAAQAAGALWAARLGAGTPAPFALAQVVRFKLQRSVHPGDTLVTHVIFGKEFGRLAQFELTLSVGGAEIARGQLVLSRLEA